jgi:arabinogalactan endo-1,4-beta-galactosidase
MHSRSKSGNKCPIVWVAGYALALQLALTIAILSLPSACRAQPTTNQTQFTLGADISALDSGNAPGRVGAFQENGVPDTEYAIMMRHGWKTFRLRVFVDPVRGPTPNNNLVHTIALAKAIKATGAKFLLDIHYSDTWADPQHQEIPLPWQDIDPAGANHELNDQAFRDLLSTYGKWTPQHIEADTAALEARVEAYSIDVITQLKNAGAMPDMVQVGNEITGGTLWPIGHLKVPPSTVKLDAGRIQPLPDPYDDTMQWSHLIRFIKAGIKGVRSAAGDTPMKIVIHIDCGGDWPVTQWFFDHLTAANVDYDIIGQSFYPQYHGTLAELQQNIIQCTRAYHKSFMVAETGYNKTRGDSLMTRGPYYKWPGTPQGQRQFLVDLVNTVKRANGIGVFYWAPERALWNRDGSPDPAVLLMDHLTDLTTRPASQIPDPPTP